MRDLITICICTLNRTQSLGRLLRNLRLQETNGLFDTSIIVVDNDASGSAESTVARLRAELGVEIEYAIERERTIPAARNHALKLARGNYIGIIDDDEFPPQTWLITMYKAIQTFEVDGALGPVYPFFAAQPPSWLLKGRFCERPVYRTGTLLHWSQTRTGNVLLKKNVFDQHQLRFDLRCKTSGSDSTFFEKAIQKGYRFVAVEEAPVYEYIPPERWTISYYVKRALVQGHSAHNNRVDDFKGLARLTVPLESTAALFAYAFTLPISAVLGVHTLVRNMAKGGYHLGRLLAILGVTLVKTRDF